MFQRKEKKEKGNCTGFSQSFNSTNIFDKHKCNDDAAMGTCNVLDPHSLHWQTPVIHTKCGHATFQMKELTGPMHKMENKCNTFPQQKTLCKYQAVMSAIHSLHFHLWAGG